MWSTPNFSVQCREVGPSYKYGGSLELIHAVFAWADCYLQFSLSPLGAQSGHSSDVAVHSCSVQPQELCTKIQFFIN